MYCPDKKGIIAAVTNFIHQRNGNIVYIDQYVDRIQGAFFMRIEVEGDFDLSIFKNLKLTLIKYWVNPFRCLVVFT
jgi:formyltetrahydrofolate deformylase